ncbi:MAG: hypothetical protein IT176_04230 [Acidobacteria bacterium]|nr:hypothetical protein [Acidobacteriota bacterium]
MTPLRRTLVCLIALLAAGAGLRAQGAGQDGEARTRELKAMLSLVDRVAGGHETPNELGLAWLREDYLKAQDRQSYVPFTVTVDPTKVPGGAVTLYWRVVARGGGASGQAAGRARKGSFPYEDLSSAVVTGDAPVPISRSFTVPAGTYDVYVLAREAAAARRTPAPKTAVLAREVVVPDFWNDALSTSSLIVVDRIEAVTAPLSREQKADHPYALGSIEIVPSYRSTFTRGSELSTFMQIYNAATDAAQLPDVVVEFSFFRKDPAGPETFFNRTPPLNLKAGTMESTFSFAAGHQLQTGQAVKLSSFPEGNYRLEIKVTDRIANKALTRDLSFRVGPS